MFTEVSGWVHFTVTRLSPGSSVTPVTGGGHARDAGSDGDGLGVGVGDALGLGSALGVGDTLGLGSALGVGDTLGLGSALGVGDTLGLGSALGVGDTLGLGSAVVFDEGPERPSRQREKDAIDGEGATAGVHRGRLVPASLDPPKSGKGAAVALPTVTVVVRVDRPTAITTPAADKDRNPRPLSPYPWATVLSHVLGINPHPPMRPSA